MRLLDSHSQLTVRVVTHEITKTLVLFVTHVERFAVVVTRVERVHLGDGPSTHRRIS